MAQKVETEKIDPKLALWDYEIQEVDGKSLEKKGREEINLMLEDGWILLSVYTLRYKDGDDTWFERPMAILGLPKQPMRVKRSKKKEYPEAIIH